MAQLKKIYVLSLAKFLGIVLGIAGLIAGILYGIGGAIIDLFTTGLNWGTALALQALIVMPIIFAIPGFIAGVIIAVSYNLISRWLGRIEIEVE
jgi:hypothetical protein